MVGFLGDQILMILEPQHRHLAPRHKDPILIRILITKEQIAIIPVEI